MSELASRFWAKVAKAPSEGCWEWTGWRNRFGYGRLSANGNPGALAHRVAWEMLCGPVPDGLCVLHHCDNPRCVRADPDPEKSHLFLGTRLDNVADMVAKGRHYRAPVRPRPQPKGHARGERYRTAKLTEHAVLEIRAARAAGAPIAALASRYGVDKSLISRAARGLVWRHVETPLDKTGVLNMQAL
jgi:hypothetical protein